VKALYDVDYGDNVKEVYRDSCKTVLQMENETGVGTMTQWSLFPGMIIMQNDFHMAFCESRFQTDLEMLCIDHCREGRIEWELSERACFYVEAGDLNITARRRHAHSFTLPLSHYHGFTIAIVPDQAAEHLPNMLGGLPIDLYALRERFCADDTPFIAVAPKLKGLDLSGMYTMPEESRLPYYRIKTLEILLYLMGMEVRRDTLEGRYFYRTQVQKIKSMMKFMTENINRHYTMEELSKRFDIPMTAMKQCFRGVYGDSIYSFMRTYRMNAAAVRLRSSSDPVSEIAAQMGYDNASKFSAAFKAVLGETPSEYRRTHTIR
jgi:AraC-like DNA-binding protein